MSTSIRAPTNSLKIKDKRPSSNLVNCFKNTFLSKGNEEMELVNINNNLH